MNMCNRPCNTISNPPIVHVDPTKAVLHSSKKDNSNDLVIAKASITIMLTKKS
jgi:hypothetical protein